MSEVVTQHKVKTKAKARYLKAKRERRKTRKAAAPKPQTKDADDDAEENESIGTDVGEDVMEPPPVIKEQPPKKRPKTSLESKSDQGDTMSITLSPSVNQISIKTVSYSPIVASPSDISLTNALPSFPPPLQPQTPSKLELNLQGLDQALLDAEVVDPSLVLQISEAPQIVNGLSQKTRNRLKELGITELFAVQTAILPFLLAKQTAPYMPYNFPRDVCVSAPTGSGKTLAYVLPLLEVLSTRIVTRLRALVVLPTRDLVSQVRETFESLCKGRGLKIGVATGQHSFSHEQAQLVGDSPYTLQGGCSKLDVLICTPGRLIDHLNGTPNFTLQHLRFLIIDEADRLLNQSFQDWLAQVLAAIKPPPQLNAPTLMSGLPTMLYHDSVAPAWLTSTASTLKTDLDENRESSCQKLLFSATLTRDPSHIASLNLRDPKYFIVKESLPGVVAHRESFSLPATLKEHMIVCDPVKKPLVLFHLVHKHAVRNALVFTKSAESTARLVNLFDFFEKDWMNKEPGRKAILARAYSSDLTPVQRRAILEEFKKQNIGILICSDLISRGIDISHVLHVVSYDAPIDMRKYVHRVGRTARAGRDGDAWSLVEEQEARYFKNMLAAADHLAKVKRMRVSAQDLEPFTAHYEVALSQLQDLYSKNVS